MANADQFLRSELLYKLNPLCTANQHRRSREYLIILRNRLLILTPVVQTQSSVQTKGQHLSTLQLALSTAAAAAAAVEIGGSSRKSPAQINKRTTKIVRNRGLGGLGERPSLDRGNLRQGR
eukprot:COSAG05_NODE_7064_length_861_cov_0.961942_1_plen_120_part_10